MSSDLGQLEDVAIFDDSSNIIKQGLEEVYHLQKGHTHITATAFEIALKKLNSK